MDDQFQDCGIPIALACNCCLERKQEYLDHVLSSGVVVSMVWKKVADVIHVYVIAEPWRIKIQRCFSGVNRSHLRGLLGVLPVIIIWRL